jgi:methyl-accepting chemotaxis protein
MSIQTKILIPLLGLVVVAILIAAFTSYRSSEENAAFALVTGKAVAAGEFSRRAHDDFDSLGDLVAEVSAMTHFVDAAQIEKRFHAGSASMDADLAGLLAGSLSPEMTKLDLDASERFAVWRGQAEGVLGLKPAPEIETLDVLRRNADGLKTVLNQALVLTGEDARAKIAEMGAAAKSGAFNLVLVAVGFGVVGTIGAFWLARNLAQPLKELVLSAERLAGGDVSITFAASSRSDEIGEISRAVARFRDNVLAAQSAEAGAASDRRGAEDERRRSEEVNSASGREQAKVVEALGAALNRLANGDLTYRLTQNFVASYARLKTDFNNSLDTLQQAMSTIVGHARDMQDGSQEISGLAVDLSQRAGEQSARLEEAAGALEEVTATVKLTAEGAGHARGIVSQTRREAEKSGEVVRTAVQAIGRIQKSSQEINKIVNVIDEIAFQTNLLALNAGVEAARAGDSGRGFAVVATEVRALAQRSAAASKEIKTLIAASNAHVDEGVDMVTSAGSALERIFAQVSEIDRVVSDIAGGAGEQANQLQGVNTGVADIDRMTQKNSAMVEKTSEASGSLAARAEELVRSVSRFQIGSGSESTGALGRRGSEEPRLRRA